MNDEQFEKDVERIEWLGFPGLATAIRNHNTVQREALARVEAERDLAISQRDSKLFAASQMTEVAEESQAQLAEAVKLLGWSKYQLMLWEDYQVENGFEVEDHYVTGKVRQEVETFLAGHAQASEVHGDSHTPAQAEQQEAREAKPPLISTILNGAFDTSHLEAQGAQAGEFQREDRYIVIKRKDLEAIERSGEAIDLETHEAVRFLAEALDTLRPHLPEHQYLVIESDWPEYEPTWAAIQARVEGRAALATQPATKVECPDRALKKALFACVNAGSEPLTYGGVLTSGGYAWVRFTVEPAVRGAEHDQ